MLLSLRIWLVIKAMEQGATFFEAQEAVASTMASWKSPDPTLRTYQEWEAQYAREENKQ
jgi:hypothetical protein